MADELLVAVVVLFKTLIVVLVEVVLAMDEPVEIFAALVVVVSKVASVVKFKGFDVVAVDLVIVVDMEAVVVVGLGVVNRFWLSSSKSRLQKSPAKFCSHRHTRK